MESGLQDQVIDETARSKYPLRTDEKPDFIEDWNQRFLSESNLWQLGVAPMACARVSGSSGRHCPSAVSGHGNRQRSMHSLRSWTRRLPMVAG
jgi:hypothetical protein